MNVGSTQSVNTISTARELQGQVQEQRKDTLQQLKPVAEQVYISKQAQQLFDTYTQSAKNAKDFYNADSTSSSNSVSTEQMLDTVKMVQKRQTTAAIAAYAQQQAGEADKPSTKPTPTSYSADQAARSISINTSA